MKNQPLHPRTAVINEKQKHQAKQARHGALHWLATHFPEAFDASISIRPLKIGIIDDILLHAEAAQAAGISKSKLREALVVFTRRVDYLTCLKLREMRVDLHGKPTTQVTAEEAEAAALKIKRRIEKSAKNARIQPLKNASPPKRSQAAAIQYESPMAANQPTTIKHKTARTFDPHAVERLKEKLGLAQKNQAITTS